MKRISINEARERIRRAGLAYIMEEDNLQYLLGEGKTVQCLADEDLLVILEPEEENQRYIHVLPFSESFCPAALTELLQESGANPVLLLNIRKLSHAFAEELDSLLRREFISERYIRDYLYTGETAPVPSLKVRLLNADDLDAFSAFPQEKIRYRPAPAVLFDVFVKKGQGQILARFDGERIVGYLALYELTDTVYDSDYIYVLPEMRGKGIGRELTAAYAEYARRQNRSAYCSNAQNDISARTAVSAGFTPIRTVTKYKRKNENIQEESI